MSWEDRVRRGAYTSPSGTRIEFDWEVVSRETDKRGTAFEFADVNDAYVQEKGFGPRRFPLRCIFSGSDCDRDATAFEAALLETGVGRLEHPLYGTFDVVPFGAISRSDDLKNNANQSIVEVTFWTTLRSVYPISQMNPRGEVLAALDDFDAAVAEQFEASTDLTTTVAKEATKATAESFLATVRAQLSEMASATDSVKRKFDDALREVELGLDVLIGQPLELAERIVSLVRMPAESAAAIAARLEGYAALAREILASTAANPGDSLAVGNSLPRRRVQVENDFRTADLVAMAAVSGSVRAVVETTYAARPDAIAAANELLEQFDVLVTWRDEAFGDIGDIDTGGAYQALQHAVSLAAGYLVEISFTLLPERRITLDRPRTIIDLAAELYGSVDDKLDFLISTNELTGSEILEVPAGRTIVYYA